MAKPTISPSLKALRSCLKSRRLRVADLARGIGRTRAAAGAIEAGTSTPDTDTAIAIEVWTNGEVKRDGWEPGLEAAVRRVVRPFVPALPPKVA